jgi:hypothetical protein
MHQEGTDIAKVLSELFETLNPEQRGLFKDIMEFEDDNLHWDNPKDSDVMSRFEVLAKEHFK